MAYFARSCRKLTDLWYQFFVKIAQNYTICIHIEIEEKFK